jgi:hypothetical protein
MSRLAYCDACGCDQPTRTRIEEVGLSQACPSGYGEVEYCDTCDEEIDTTSNAMRRVREWQMREDLRRERDEKRAMLLFVIRIADSDCSAAQKVSLMRSEAMLRLRIEIGEEAAK